MKKFILNLFGITPQINVTKQQPEVKENYDPLDVVSRNQAWVAAPIDPIQRKADDFPKYTPSWELNKAVQVGDSAITKTVTDAADAPISAKFNTSAAVPNQLQNWYMSQSFIGYQACALIAQHWLVDKACSMAGQDAVRNGWTLNAKGDTTELTKEDHDKLRSYDVKFQLKSNLAELDRFKNVFGVRVAVFEVDSDDEHYYEKPFNIDGVTEGSYRGISQIDPYWMTPLMTSNSTLDPVDIHFYDPEFWVIGGRKYHRSHLIIARGPQPADVLKPTYIFGGISLTQRIYERIYAAERTANEAPLLALSKRTTSLHVDVEKMITQQKKFEEKLMQWIKYRDNHAVKVLGKDEVMEQFDTNLSDFDSIIMNQFQLVAAIAEVPATKLLGTSPKGFNATGEFELLSYHEKLESIQEHTMSPMATRHYEILCKSLGINAEVEVVFEPVDAVSMKAKAEINDLKATTAEKYVNMGSVSPDEVRESLRDDKHSGFNRLTDDEAETELGASPENLAEFEKVGAEQQKSEAAENTSIAKIQQTEKQPTEEQRDGAAIQSQLEDDSSDLDIDTPTESQRQVPLHAQINEELAATLKLLSERLAAIEAAMIPENKDLTQEHTPSIERSTKPSISGLEPSVVGVGALVPKIDSVKQPKMRVAGLLVSIENPRNTLRQGMDVDGGVWSCKMPHHYGFIKGTMGADGEEVDCFVGKNLTSDKVFVINQVDPSTGAFDEHKCMIGFDSEDEAKQAYQEAYSNDWKGLGTVIGLSVEDFNKWLSVKDNCTKPI